jgi:hypothetical protein
MPDAHDDVDLREALRDELTQAARDEMDRLRAEAAAGDEKAARLLERLGQAIARKQAGR